MLHPRVTGILCLSFWRPNPRKSRWRSVELGIERSVSNEYITKEVHQKTFNYWNRIEQIVETKGPQTFPAGSVEIPQEKMYMYCLTQNAIYPFFMKTIKSYFSKLCRQIVRFTFCYCYTGTIKRIIIAVVSAWSCRCRISLWVLPTLRSPHCCWCCWYTQTCMHTVFNNFSIQGT